MDFAIYGAQGMALGVYEAIHNLYPTKKIRCFLVTNREKNPEYLSGILVLELKSFAANLSKEEKENIGILIATPENVMLDIEKSLDEQELYCHIRLTSLRWAELMSYHYAYDRCYMPLRLFPIGYHRANIHMFIAKFYKDKPLKEEYHIPKWMIPIQVGTVLCKERIANILDCNGYNISNKNKNYSELTALYWIWKNQLSQKSKNERYEYYGLSHYRRILELSEDDILRLADNDVDVVLPYPMPYEPNIEMHHKRYLKEKDWDVVLFAIQHLQPEYAKRIQDILKQRYFYNYNIMLARKEVLADYCSWLFPILECVEELSVPKSVERADRYIGYIGESLATLYFMINRDKLNITHTGCRFLM